MANIKIAVIDDHTLFRKGLINLIRSLGDEYEVIFEASNGEDFLQQLSNTDTLPQIALVDINMPKKDGFETVSFLQEHYPSIRLLIVSMIDKEETVVRMLKNGVR